MLRVLLIMYVSMKNDNQNLNLVLSRWKELIIEEIKPNRIPRLIGIILEAEMVEALIIIEGDKMEAVEEEIEVVMITATNMIKMDHHHHQTEVEQIGTSIRQLQLLEEIVEAIIINVVVVQIIAMVEAVGVVDILMDLIMINIKKVITIIATITIITNGKIKIKTKIKV